MNIHMNVNCVLVDGVSFVRQDLWQTALEQIADLCENEPDAVKAATCAALVARDALKIGGVSPSASDAA